MVGYLKKQVKILSEVDEKKLLKQADNEVKKIGRRDFRKKAKLETGDVIVYKYKDPVTMKQMKKFDVSPLVVVVKTFNRNGKSYMFGINLHWVSTGSREKVFNHIIDNYFALATEIGSEKVKTKKLIRLTYDKIKADGTLRKEVLGNNAFRLYLTHIMSDVRYVPIKYYNQIFKADLSSALRARWAFQSKGYIVKGYREK